MDVPSYLLGKKAGGGGGGGTPTDVKINGVSITSDNVADIQTKGTYNAETNKIATEEDIPNVPSIIVLTENEYESLTEYADNTEYHIIED